MDKFVGMEPSSLILLIRAGNSLAFSELVSRYLPMVNKVISGFDIPQPRLEEAYSEAHVALYRAALSYNLSRDSVTFGLNARVCVYNKICDFVGKELRPDLNVTELSDIEVPSVFETSLVGREELKRYHKVARSILSDYEYSVFRLYLNGYTTREIAEALSKSAKSVDNAKNRMMKALRQHSDFFFN
jgi:RNA polymerase sporulation-specific sigma factor